jgi:hypothetical protein
MQTRLITRVALSVVGGAALASVLLTAQEAILPTLDDGTAQPHYSIQADPRGNDGGAWQNNPFVG